MSISSSKYRGVVKDRSGRHEGAPWRAQIRVDHQVIGWPVRFEQPEDAARVYDVMALTLRGPNAKLNFDGQPPVGILVVDIQTFLCDRGVLSPSRLRGTHLPNFCEPPLF